MRTTPLLLVSIPSLALVACAATDGTRGDAIHGDCTDGCGGGSGSGSSTGSGTGSGTGGDACDLGLTADVSIAIQGTGTFVGIDPSCGVALSGGFEADVAATASYDCAAGTWSIDAMASGGAAIHTDGGCTCQDIDVNACGVASASVHASIAADLDTCGWFCGEHGGGDACVSACAQAGNTIDADVDVDAATFAGVDLGSIDASAMSNLDLDLDFATVLDAGGNVVSCGA